MPSAILIIEDEVDILELVSIILERAGYVVAQARDAEAGWQRLAQLPCDLIIVDVNLPDIDGWEVCRRLRAESRTACVPILLFTVRSELADDALQHPELVDGFISKPFDRAELLALIAKLLARTPVCA